MKQIILTFALLICVTTAFGQNKYQQKKIDYFTKEAVKEYSLNDVQKSEVEASYTKMVISYNDIKDLPSEEKKSKQKEISKEFNNSLIKTTGKTYPELKPFLTRVRSEIKEL